MASVPITTKPGGPTVRDVPPVRVAHEVVRELRHAWSERTDREVFAYMIIPLAMIAMGLIGLWWTWIPLTSMAWLAVPRWRWGAALLAIHEGAVGTAWAYVGATWLGEYPEERGLVTLLFVGFPCAVAAAGHLNRRRGKGST
jgi:hypothetical protein